MTKAAGTITSHAAKSRAPLERRAFRVRVVAGPDAGAEAEPDGDRLCVGLAPDTHLTLTDPAVSRYHVDLEALDDGVAVRDLGSKNGVWLGAVLVRDAVLRESADILVGDSRLRVIVGDDRRSVALSRATSYGGLVGGSPAIRAVYTALEKAAPTLAPVLIYGESGTGKELTARAIHAASSRAGGPFEVVDCGGLSPTLIESELFGHERGAFTGADRERAGAFERASGGTLFLDELGELPLEVQPKLLRALGEREVRRVGGSRTRLVDVRIVAATNRDLRRAVNGGTFREDLFYRLAVIQIRMPPLRERLEDLPILVAALLESMEDELGLPTKLDVDIEQLFLHAWPGNVRELKNYLQQVVVLDQAPALDGHAPDTLEGLCKLALHKAMDRFEQLYVARLLFETKSNISAAAQRAGINRATLYRTLQRHGLKVER